LDVSVIIPTFRREPALVEALESVLSQRDGRLEVFVVDDSPEASARGPVGRLRDSRVTYIANPTPSHGLPALVRNIAWPQARGQAVHFLDDDDRVPAGHYAAVIETMRRLPDVGVVFGRVAPFGEDAAAVSHEERFFARSAKCARLCGMFGPRLAFSARMLFGETLLVCGAAMVRRSCLPAVGGFDPSVRLMEDVDFYGRAIRAFGAHFLDQVALHYRIGPSLMHRADVGDLVNDAYRRMRSKYRRDRGAFELLMMRALSKTVLAVV
jgi:GT2 family glycosyltransferase